MNKIFFLILLAPLVIYGNEDEHDKWVEFKEKFQKSYKDGHEEEKRMKIFLENSQKIYDHNIDHERGKTSFTLRMNQFGDLSSEEFMANLHSLNVAKRSMKGKSFQLPQGTAPYSIDWRHKGAILPAGKPTSISSSASSVISALESANYIKTGKLIRLSEKNLIDCVDPRSDFWEVNKGFQFAKEMGVHTLGSYPSKNDKNAHCELDKKVVGVKCTDYIDIPTGDEDMLKTAVGLIGPMTAMIDANNYSFQFYHAGIYEEPSCKSDTVSHAVIVIGYDNEEGSEYWLIQNSWGQKWGINGTMSLLRNKKNHCGIASMASYPTL